jgi:putative ABC transport system permease protein
MWKLTVKSLLARKLRLTLTSIAIVLGVSFIVASFVVADTLRSTFDELAQDIQGDTDITVRTYQEFGNDESRQPLDASVLDLVEGVEGVAAAAPNVGVQGVALIKDGKTVGNQMGPPVIGINYDQTPELNTFVIAEGRPPEGPDEFALDTRAAKDDDFEVGQTYTVSSPVIGNHEYELVGIFKFNEADDDPLATLVAFDTPTAQAFAGLEGKYSSISVKVEDGFSRVEVERNLSEALPPGLEAVDRTVTVEETQETFDQISSIFGNVLLAFAIITLVVSAFLINNTFQIVIGQRVRELALIRAIGATGRQVSRSVLLESLLVGALSTVVGIVAGVALSFGLRGLLGALGFDLPSKGIELRPRTVIIAIIVGVGVTMLASLAPARKARRVPPIAAMREDYQLSSTTLRRRIIVGTVVTAVGAFFMGWGLFGDLDTAPLLTTLAFGALLVFVGVNLLSPLVARPVARLLGHKPTAIVLLIVGPLLMLGGAAIVVATIAVIADQGKPFPGVFLLLLAALVGSLGWLALRTGLTGRDPIIARLGRENAGRNRRRTASTASALMIGLALVSMAAVVADSLKTTFLDILGNAVEADYMIQSDTGGGPGAGGIPPVYAEELRQQPEIESVVEYRFDTKAVRIEGKTKDLFATEFDDFWTHLDIDVEEGSVENLGPNDLLVYKDSAEDLGLHVGDQVPATFIDGRTDTLTVAAIYGDASIVGNWVIDLDLWKQHFANDQDGFVSAKLKDGVTPEQGQAAIDRVTDKYEQIDAETKAEFEDSTEQQLNSFLAVISGFLVFALLIALLGIANTLALSVFERTRELGLLRAVGTTRDQTGGMIRWEAVIVATFGALLGVVLGIVFGVAASSAVPESVIQTISIPWSQIVAFMLLAAVFGTAAAFFPARRAARLNVLEAIQYN